MRESFFEPFANRYQAKIHDNLAIFHLKREQMESFARIFLSQLPPWKEDTFTLLLKGEMGSGKTTFVRHLGSLLGNFNVHSPTFNLLNIYETSRGDIFHFDFFRIRNVPSRKEELEDFLLSPGLKCIEWPPSDLISCLTNGLELEWIHMGLDLRQLKIRLIK